MPYPKHLLALAPLTRTEFPGWLNVLHVLGAFRADGWSDAPVRKMRGKWHGYEMALDLRFVADRAVFFGGRYLDVESQRVVQTLLREGDTFVDVGANTGMITLVGARAVGASGRVHSFEPNPSVFSRLEANIRGNKELERVVTLHNEGLSDAPGTFPLHVPLDNPDMGTFGASVKAEHKQLATREVSCRVVVGDEVLAALPERPTAIKIDVEGFETSVLRGLSRTLDRVKPAVLTEVEPELLHNAGTSVAELAEMMFERGYKAYWSTARQTRPKSFIRSARLTPMKAITDEVSTNVLWVPPGSVFEQRIAGLVHT